MIPTSIIFRTIHIRRNGSTGTAFVLDVDNKQYYITARHVIEGVVTGDTIEINYQKTWNNHKVIIIGHSQHSDISVFAVPTGKVRGETLEVSSNDIYHGQDLYFLGFPYGLQSDIANLNSDFPIPFIKKGILSNFLLENPQKILFLDGLNNPGFSGGPVVYFHQQTQTFKLAGIISGYRFEITNAMHQNQDIDIQIKTNTGIIISYGIEAALELIYNNPIGADI
ncbi:S1 family peptidase [Flavobacterium luteolum]|uniref:S1 family peptidase n=1 Tax=Flavobacterium luteolum TaxID=3003259 RepID=UPI00248DBEC6|nr:serine protease [Flavobacterium luteolum]